MLKRQKRSQLVKLLRRLAQHSDRTAYKWLRKAGLEWGSEFLITQIHTDKGKSYHFEVVVEFVFPEELSLLEPFYKAVPGICFKRDGDTYVALCPFHKERTPSFRVNGEKWIFHCFGCHKHGKVDDFHRMYLKHLSSEE